MVEDVPVYHAIAWRGCKVLSHTTALNVTEGKIPER